MRLERLPRHVTGFFGEDALRTSNSGAFKKACHAVSGLDGGSVENVDLSLVGRSFYGATLLTSTEHISVLCNCIHPFLAFVPPGSFGVGFPELTFVAPVHLSAVFSAMTEFEPLDVDWLRSEPKRGLLADLHKVELEQIEEWNPQCVGDIIFNCWD